LDQKLAAQTAHVAELVDQKLAAQEVRLDQKLAAQTAHVENTMAQAIESAVAILRATQEDLAERIVQLSRAITENVEGRKIVSLAEASQFQKAVLDDHENRIRKLEEVIG
jgi:23S rRNA pseudoU1915 N3-methylase RlmH